MKNFTTLSRRKSALKDPFKDTLFVPSHKPKLSFQTDLKQQTKHQASEQKQFRKDSDSMMHSKDEAFSQDSTKYSEKLGKSKFVPKIPDNFKHKIEKKLVQTQEKEVVASIDDNTEFNSTHKSTRVDTIASPRFGENSARNGYDNSILSPTFSSSSFHFQEHKVASKTINKSSNPVPTKHPSTKKIEQKSIDITDPGVDDVEDDDLEQSQGIRQEIREGRVSSNKINAKNTSIKALPAKAPSNHKKDLQQLSSKVIDEEGIDVEEEEEITPEEIMPSVPLAKESEVKKEAAPQPKPSIKEVLKAIYQANDTIPRLIEALDDLEEISIKEYYVNLQIIQKQTASYAFAPSETVSGQKEDIDIKDIFANLANRPSNKVLILGGAGTGKTTLTQYMSYSWAEGNLWKNKFEYVYKITLKNLLSTNWLEWFSLQKGKDDILKAFICYNLDPENEYGLTTSTLPLSETKNKILLIVDGYDEVRHLEGPIYKKIMKGILEHPNLVLTSRPNSIDKEISKKFDSVVENVGLNNDAIDEYLAKYFKGQEDLQRQIKEFLNVNPQIKEICKVPVNIAMLCYIFSDLIDGLGEGENFDPKNVDRLSSMHGLYKEVIDMLSKRYIEKKLTAKSQTSIQISEKLEHHNQNLDELRVLEHLSKQGLGSGRLLFKGSDRKEASIDKSIEHLKLNSSSKITIGDVYKYGLLLTEKKLSAQAKETDYHKYLYRFIHLTFQEYLAACELKREMLQEQKRSDICEWIAKNRYDPKYLMMFKFMSGIISSQEDSDELVKIFWEAVSCNIDGTIELGVQKKVTLLMHLLSQAKIDGEIDTRIPNGEKIEKLIVETILQNMLGWKDQIKESGYLPLKAQQQLIEIFLNSSAVEYKVVGMVSELIYMFDRNERDLILNQVIKLIKEGDNILLKRSAIEGIKQVLEYTSLGENQLKALQEGIFANIGNEQLTYSTSSLLSYLIDKNIFTFDYISEQLISQIDHLEEHFALPKIITIILEKLKTDPQQMANILFKEIIKSFNSSASIEIQSKSRQALSAVVKYLSPESRKIAYQKLSTLLQNENPEIRALPFKAKDALVASMSKEEKIEYFNELFKGLNSPFLDVKQISIDKTIDLAQELGGDIFNDYFNAIISMIHGVDKNTKQKILAALIESQNILNTEQANAVINNCLVIVQEDDFIIKRLSLSCMIVLLSKTSNEIADQIFGKIINEIATKFESQPMTIETISYYRYFPDEYKHRILDIFKALCKNDYFREVHMNNAIAYLSYFSAMLPQTQELTDKMQEVALGYQKADQLFSLGEKEKLNKLLEKFKNSALDKKLSALTQILCLKHQIDESHIKNMMQYFIQNINNPEAQQDILTSLMHLGNDTPAELLSVIQILVCAGRHQKNHLQLIQANKTTNQDHYVSDLNAFFQNFYKNAPSYFQAQFLNSLDCINNLFSPKFEFMKALDTIHFFLHTDNAYMLDAFKDTCFIYDATGTRGKGLILLQISFYFTSQYLKKIKENPTMHKKESIISKVDDKDMSLLFDELIKSLDGENTFLALRAMEYLSKSFNEVFAHKTFNIITQYLNHKNIDYQIQGYRVINTILDKLNQDAFMQAFKLLFNSFKSDNVVLKATCVFGLQQMIKTMNEKVIMTLLENDDTKDIVTNLLNEEFIAELVAKKNIYESIKILLQIVDQLNEEDKEVEILNRSIAQELENALIKNSVSLITQNLSELLSISKKSKEVFTELYRKTLSDSQPTPDKKELIIELVKNGFTTSITREGEIAFEGLKKRFTIKSNEQLLKDIQKASAKGKTIEEIEMAIVANSNDPLAEQYRANNPLFPNSGLGLKVASSDISAVKSIVDKNHILDIYHAMITFMKSSKGLEIVLLETRNPKGDQVLKKYKKVEGEYVIDDEQFFNPLDLEEVREEIFNRKKHDDEKYYAQSKVIEYKNTLTARDYEEQLQKVIKSLSKEAYNQYQAKGIPLFYGDLKTGDNTLKFIYASDLATQNKGSITQLLDQFQRIDENGQVAAKDITILLQQNEELFKMALELSSSIDEIEGSSMLQDPLMQQLQAELKKHPDLMLKAWGQQKGQGNAPQVNDALAFEANQIPNNDTGELALIGAA